MTLLGKIQHMEVRVSDSELTANIIVSRMVRNLKVAMPAKVVNVEDLVNGFISVKPIVNYQNKQTLVSYEYGEIQRVKVQFPSTKTSSITMPVNVGDIVDLIFQSVGIQDILNGNTGQQDPIMHVFNNMLDCVALIGFEPFQQSCMNPNNYQNDFDNQNLNIVHNKNTDNEVTFTLRTDGTVGVIAPEGVDYTTKKFKVDCEEFEVNASKSSRIISPLISQNGI